MNVYEIRLVEDFGPGLYPWVGIRGPLIDNGFIDRLPMPYRATELQMLKANTCAIGLQLDGGKTWPDFMGGGGSVPPNYIAARVLDHIAQAQISIYHKTHAPIASVLSGSKRLKMEPAPDYYVVEANAGFVWNWREMGYELNSDGTPNRNIKPIAGKGFCIDAKSWKGLDLCCCGDPMWRVNLYCTDKVRDLANEMKWTNVKFEQIRII